MRSKFYPLLVLLILVGFAFRLVLLTAFPLREDEAIYSFWALHFLHEDPWFLHVWPDKPPLFIWLLSGAFALWGESSASGRYLNVLLSTLTIPIVGTIARRLWGERAELIAVAAMTLNPFAISFAPTLFTDPLLVFSATLALYLAMTGVPFWSGLWLGVAIMTKQQGLLYLPLVLGVMLIGKTNKHSVGAVTNRTTYREQGACGYKPHLHTLLQFLLGMLLIVTPVLLWDSQRWSVAPSPWDWSVHNYAPLTLVLVADWPQRLRIWGDLLWYLTASGAVWGVLLVGILVWLLQTWRKRSAFVNPYPLLTRRALRYSPTLFLLWSFGFIVLHLVTTLQPWDRYLLPLAPFLALFISWLGSPSDMDSQTTNPQFSFSLLTLLLLLFPAWQAANGRLPIGGDHGAYRGLDTIINELNMTFEQEMPTVHNHSTILYHRELGWHYRFYLYDQVRSHQVELRWYPSAVYLTDNASKAPHLRKFLIEPDWSPTQDLAFALRVRGLVLQQLRHIGNFTLFEIVQPSQAFCEWCRCRVERYPFPTLTTLSDKAMICK
ncbi:MAG: glycosyltransferase family 39 protein [Caldilineaceae bacterium]